MKIPCPKCSGKANQIDERVECPHCGYSTDDFVRTRNRFARVSEAAPDITKPLPSRRVNGSKEEK